MTKCSVRSVRKRYAGSNSVAARAGDAVAASAAALAMSDAMIDRNARDILQEREIGGGQEMNAAERAPRHRDVRLAPEADVWLLLGDDPLHVAVQRAPTVVVSRDGRCVEQAIDASVLKESAVEAGRRHLRRVKHAPQDVGIRDGAAHP